MRAVRSSASVAGRIAGRCSGSERGQGPRSSRGEPGDDGEEQRDAGRAGQTSCGLTCRRRRRVKRHGSRVHGLVTLLSGRADVTVERFGTFRFLRRCRRWRAGWRDQASATDVPLGAGSAPTTWSPAAGGTAPEYVIALASATPTGQCERMAESAKESYSRTTRWLLVAVVVVCGVFVAGVLAFGAATYLGFLPRPALVERSEVEPLPRPLFVVYDGTYPCRGSGEIGWQYRYLVVRGDAGAPGGTLYDHLRDRGFVVEPASDEWRRFVARRGDVEVSVGPLHAALVEERSILRGPLTTEARNAVKDEPGPLALMELLPNDRTCEV